MSESLVLIGRDGEIRTHDPLHPMQVRYRAALHPDVIGKIRWIGPNPGGFGSMGTGHPLRDCKYSEFRTYTVIKNSFLSPIHGLNLR